MAYFEKTGNSWRAQIRRKGFKTISKSFPRKIDAQMWAREIEGTIDDRSYHEPNMRPVKELFARYRDEVSVKKLGAKWEKNRIDKFLREMTLMDLPIGELSFKHVAHWRDARLKEVSNDTVNREMNVLSAVFKHAINEWHTEMAENPCAKVKRPEKAKHRTRRILESEVAGLWITFGTTIKSKRTYLPWLFEFAIETAMRMGELCRLRWEDVHEDERWLYVLPSKNGDDRSIPLSARALELLAGLPRTDVRVFPVSLGSVDTEFRRAITKLGYADLHFHDTRHEACTRLSKVFGVLDLAKVVGHRDLKSLMVYYNPTARELAAKFPEPQSMHPHPTLATADDAHDD